MPTTSQAMSIIRDTEIENILQKWSEPVLKAADLKPNSVDIILVNSDSVNAFVAGGANIFIYSGLIEASEYPEEVIGVIGHEIGHIVGGHLIATKDAMEKASFQSILANVLGIGAAIVTGDGRAASAISLGGSGFAANGFLSHSRVQESAADQAGLSYLKKADINPNGLVSFLEKLEGQELLPASQQSEYMRTHPLTRNRIDTMRHAVKHVHSDPPLGQSINQHEFNRIKAKLMAFRTPHNIPRYYNGNSDNEIDLYAFAIMAYQQKDFKTAINKIDQAIAKKPKDPYLYEMKAQILRDSGNLAESEKCYKKSLNLIKTKAPLIKISLAHVMVEQRKNDAEVEKLLQSAIQDKGRDARAFRLMATLRGRQQLENDAQYFLAEEAITVGNKSEARRLLNLALNSGKLSSDLKIKANDLKLYLNRLPKADE